MATDPQKSEVHQSTGDASTSPSAGQDQDTTRHTPSGRTPDPGRPVKPLNPPDFRIVDDQTDDGGPLSVESDDPDLNPPKAPIDPFPTDRKPEIDPPVR